MNEFKVGDGITFNGMSCKPEEIDMGYGDLSTNHIYIIEDIYGDLISVKNFNNPKIIVSRFGQPYNTIYFKKYNFRKEKIEKLGVINDAGTN